MNITEDIQYGAEPILESDGKDAKAYEHMPIIISYRVFCL